MSTFHEKERSRQEAAGMLPMQSPVPAMPLYMYS
jgi:hypothetical protein